MSSFRWLPTWAIVVAAACLIAGAPKNEKTENDKAPPLAPGDSVLITKKGTELKIDDEIVIKLDAFIELKVLKIEGERLHCQMLSADGRGRGWVKKAAVTRHPLCLRTAKGVLRFVLSQTAIEESDAIKRRDALAEADTARLLRVELTEALQAHQKSVLPPRATSGDLRLLTKRLSEPLAAVAKKRKVLKTLHNQVDNVFTLHAAYLIAEIEHKDILAAIEPELEKLAREKSWDADALKAGVARVIGTLTTAAGGNRLYVSGRFRK